jgi:hypothetical protein
VSATVRLRPPRAALSDEDRETIVERVTAEAKRWKAVAPPLTELPREGAWFSILHLDSAGNLWFDRRLGDNWAVDVHAPSGRLLGRVSAAGLGMSPILTQTHVYSLERDKDDITHLVARRIER